MCSCIDALSQSTDNGETDTRQVLGEVVGIPLTAPDKPKFFEELLLTWDLNRSIISTRFPTNANPTVEFAQDYNDTALMPLTIVLMRNTLLIQEATENCKKLPPKNEPL